MKLMKPLNFDQSGRIAVLFNGKLIIVEISTILYCEASGNYCTIHLTNGESYTDSYGLKCLKQQLGEFGFFPIDKSVIINLLHIHSITSERHARVSLGESVELKVSRDRKAELMKLLFTFCYALISGELCAVFML